MEYEKRVKRFKCDECSSAFTSPSNLRFHKSSVHSELRPFQCEHCDYSGKLKSTLNKHYATHFPQIYKTQTCPNCPYKCSQLSKLLTHLRVHTKEKPFACHLCSYRALDRSFLTAHTRTHTGEKPFKCSLCTSTFTNSSHLTKHKLFVHNKKNVTLVLVPCSFPGCDRKFTNKHKLTRHVESFHNKEKRFSCPHCQKAFYAKVGCGSHFRQRHTTKRPYKCSVCEYAAATSSIIKKHESTKHGEYMAVECPVCQRKYKNLQSLAKYHKYAHSNAKGSKESAPQWKCKEPGCTKEYKFRQGLGQHVNSFHLQQRPFKCLYCDHATTTSSMLDSHLKTHTREKPYSCNTCRRSFTTNGELSRHKATAHSELRPFQCVLCIYKAKTKARLKQHQRIHEPKQTNSEYNICKVTRGSKDRTNYSFGTRCRLSYHMRKTHFNEASFARSLRTPGSKFKGAAISKSESSCIKGFNCTVDCPPCLVRPVRKTELKLDPLCETTIKIYS